MANTSFVVFAEAAASPASAPAAGAPAAQTNSNSVQVTMSGDVGGETNSVQVTTSGDAGAGQQAPPPSSTMMMVPFIILIAVMIAISIRTSSKEKKKREEMMNSIRKGTKIMTSGGILGEIAEVQKDQFMLKIANNVQIAISRSAVAQVIQPAADAADTKAEVTKK